MQAKAWPFLIGRNRRFDYRVIVAPAFMTGAGMKTQWLAESIGAASEQTPAGSAIYREVQSPQSDRLTLVFRVLPAIARYLSVEAGTEPLVDEHSRPISLVEGLVLQDWVPSIKITEGEMQRAHEAVLRGFAEFWHSSSPLFPTSPSEAIELGTSNEAGNGSALQLTIMPPAAHDKILRPSESDPQLSTSRTSSGYNRYVLVRTISHPRKSPVCALASSPVEGLIAIRYMDQQVRVSLSEDPGPYGFLEPESSASMTSCSTVSFGSGGLLVATGIKARSYNSTVFWDVRTGKIRGTIPGAAPTLLSFSRGKETLLATGGIDATINLWTISMKEELRIRSYGQLVRHKNTVTALTFCPGKPYPNGLISGDRAGELIYWDAAEKVPGEHIVAHRVAINALAITRDSQFLATGGADGLIKIWTVEESKLVGSIKTPSRQINSLSFGMANDVLVWAGDDTVVRAWNWTKKGEVLSIQGHNAEVVAVTVSNDGKYLVSGDSDGVVNVWLYNR